MRAFVVFVLFIGLAMPARAQSSASPDVGRGQEPVLLDVTVILGTPPGPSFRQSPRAPEPGRRRALPLRADFRSAVLASAGAL